jgi:hypothetical protein
MAENLVEGWTERIRQTLLGDNAAVNLTGLTVSLQLYDRNDRLTTPSGAAGIDTAAAGIAYFDPAGGDLLARLSPYRIRWKVVDGSGKITYFPNDSPDLWIVRKP